jgi:hypothetical protein
MKKIYTGVLLLSVCTFSFSQTKKLSLIGSSTSACYGFGGAPGEDMNFVNCYIHRLVSYYATQGTTVDVNNDAVTGMNVYEAMPTGYPPTLINGVSYSPNTLKNITHAIAFGPDVVLVNYPTNAYQHLDVHQVMLYLRTIKKAANDAGKPCFVTTTQPRNDFEFTPAIRLRLMEIRDSVNAQFGYFAVDFWSGLADGTGAIINTYDQGDDIHLNHLGHDILFQRVRDKSIFTAALPVRLVSFKAKSSGDDVVLYWTVSNEAGNTSYTLQRSEDGIQFTSLNEVIGMNAQGLKNYRYTDKNPAGSLLFYRVQINENGKSFYSPIEKIFSGNSSVSITNIASKKNETKLIVESRNKETIRILLRNILGETIHVSTGQLQPGTNQFRIQHALLTPGIYSVQVFNGDARLSSRSFMNK